MSRMLEAARTFARNTGATLEEALELAEDQVLDELAAARAELTELRKTHERLLRDVRRAWGVARGEVKHPDKAPRAPRSAR